MQAKVPPCIFGDTCADPPDNNLKLNNEPIPWVQSYKYLGVTLDSKLTWGPHVTETVRKTKAAHASLSYLSKFHCRLSIKSKLLLYKSFVRPVALYAAPVWSCCAKSGVEKIQAVQSKILRRIVKATRYVRNDIIHRDLSIRPIHLEIKKLAMKFFEGIPIINNPVLNSIKAYDPAKSSSAKRPRAILCRSDDFISVSKRRRIEV